MKKFALTALIGLILLTSFPKEASAQRLGEMCGCKPEQTNVADGCIDNTDIQKITKFEKNADGICIAGSAIIIAPIVAVAGGLALAAPALVPEVVKACKDNTDTLIDGAIHTSDYGDSCQKFLTGVSLSLSTNPLFMPLAGTALGGNFLSKVLGDHEYGVMVDACANFVEKRIGKIITPATCDSPYIRNLASYCSNEKDATAAFNMCLPIKDEDKYKSCMSCASSGGVLTGLGCIKTNPQLFIADFLKIALGIAGGIALLLMIYGAFLVSVSAGDPKKADEGKEMITGTIAGLLFIIFSVFLLKLIGVDILQIPGF